MKGFTQVKGIDFQETFLPIARYEAIHFLLAHAALEDWKIEALDIKTAFLYGELDKEIYMEQPEGFVKKGQEGHVCRLLKAIYSLKQALQIWNEKLHKTLLANGFRRTCSNAGVYVHNQWEMILIIYVDNLLPMGPRLDRITLIKKILAKQFQMRDLSAATTFWRMQIERDRKNRILRIDQKAYTEGIISRFDMMNAKPLRTPLPEGIHLEKAPDNYTAKDKFQMNYQAMIGSLIYLMIGLRLNIAWSVIRLSQYMQNLTQLHVDTCKHIFCYL